MAKVVICESMLRPSVISVPSESQGDGTTYEVVSSTLFNDSFCTCPGFQFRGTCKHERLIAETRCTYHRVAREDDTQGWWNGELGKCPMCSTRLILYELDPEFD